MGFWIKKSQGLSHFPRFLVQLVEEARSCSLVATRNEDFGRNLHCGVFTSIMCEYEENRVAQIGRHNFLCWLTRTSCFYLLVFQLWRRFWCLQSIPSHWKDAGKRSAEIATHFILVEGEEGKRIWYPFMISTSTFNWWAIKWYHFPIQSCIAILGHLDLIKKRKD